MGVFTGVPREMTKDVGKTLYFCLLVRKGLYSVVLENRTFFLMTPPLNGSSCQRQVSATQPQSCSHSALNSSRMDFLP